jgi:ABC-type transporter Mla MlaB component
MESKPDVKLNTEEEKINTYVVSMENIGAFLLRKEGSTKKSEQTNCLIRSNELFQRSEENPVDALAGAYIEGVHYYDFKNVQFINNTGMASLIDIVKCLLEQGVKVQFVNVSEKIKNKIKSMGLENVINCS